MISDLHIGASSRADLLRRSELREPLVEAVRGVDRLVVLGDGLELRDGPHRDATALAGPFFADMGGALGADGELLLAAGNHDHGLVAGWIDGRLMVEPSGFLELEQRIEPDDAGPLAAALAERAAPARVQVVYPGVWLREDVYAIHGHYSDLHATVPTFERLAAGAMARWAVALPADGATPDDYEAVLSPLYAWIHALTQRSEHALVSAGAGASSRAWIELGGSGRRMRVRTALLRAGFSAAIAGANALGIGPVDRDISGPGLRRGVPERLHRDAAPARRSRAARDLRPLAPFRAVAGRRPRGVDHARRRPAAQHGLVGLPAALPDRRGGHVALLAGHGRPHRGRRAAAAAAAAGRARPSGASTPGVKQVAWQVTPGPISSSSTAAVWCGWRASS